MARRVPHAFVKLACFVVAGDTLPRCQHGHCGDHFLEVVARGHAERLGHLAPVRTQKAQSVVHPFITVVHDKSFAFLVAESS